MQQLTKPLSGPDGQPFSVAFNEGLPPSGNGPCIFVLDDGSIHAGAIVRNSGTFPSGALCTTNSAGLVHEQFEIPLHRVVGYADAGAQYDQRDSSSWLRAAPQINSTSDRKHVWDRDPLVDGDVIEALAVYKRALIPTHRRNWWHRVLCWSGNINALRRECILNEAIANARTVVRQSSEHEMALERYWRLSRDEDASRLMSLLAANNGW